MREQYPAPDGVVGLIVGIVLSTALGEFAVWLPLESSVQLASGLADIAENADELRDRYLERLQHAGAGASA